MTQESLHIEGRRWFESTNGNTYHSVRIWRNGKQLTTIPFEYGYDDGYLQTAMQYLIAQDLAPKDAIGSTRYVREDLKGTYSVIDVTRKKDL